MKNNISVILVTLALLALHACNSYDFEQEQYRNEINLLSNSSLIYDRQVADLKGEGDTLYLVAGLSGSQPSGKSMKVSIMEADSLLKAYNKSNFDIDHARFAKLLPKKFYSIPETSNVIKPGEFQVKFPVILKDLEELSPDSIYFLNYRIDPVGTDAFNDNKKEVLFRIYKKNEFATTKTNTFYNYTSSYIYTGSETPRRPTSSNQVFPLGVNSVRLMAGDETFGEYKSALEKINQRSIVLQVGEKTPQNPNARKVTISPYRTIDVQTMPPTGEYDNTFRINVVSTPDGRANYYKEFRLHYKYRLTATDPYREVQAILRQEYNPRADLL
ncbi:BT_3044 domain-containing protein [Proteiniphilum sp. X52]|uniref:BT_3044 domain-containing protein n=1 Tax=Proteiniphilum sp. X52 TaxID=2382159 RepID=UPI000F0A54E2|nr:DUF4361 domain-containing protein [Proteiniphilum sp. X52]RNC63842.1 DUF4361 domain-containing protein [Proteiniphilum sp. X52]